MRRPAAGDAGFSLVEALVALVVLSIATLGLVRATESHIETVRGLQDRAAAQWVAENRLVELGLPGGASAAATSASSEEMLGRRWNVAVQSRGTDDPDLARVTVAVTPDGATTPLATLEGFVDRGGGVGP